LPSYPSEMEVLAENADLAERVEKEG